MTARPTEVIVFPFDQFGSAGTGAGATLLGDAIQEMLRDVEEETVPHRGAAYRDAIAYSEYAFDTLAQCSAWLRTAKTALKANPERGTTLFLAGNHLACLPLYESLGPETLVLQFDAHLDVYNLADTTEELSHGNFLMHAKKPLPKIINIGSRDCFLDPAHAARYFHTIHDACAIARDATTVNARIAVEVQQAKRVWLDLDCDALDPAFFPAVQHPQPFGLTPLYLLGLLEQIWNKNIIGLSISEFDPGRDHHDQSLSLLIWLVEWFFLKVHEG